MKESPVKYFSSIVDTAEAVKNHEQPKLNRFQSLNDGSRQRNNSSGSGGICDDKRSEVPARKLDREQ